MFYSIRKRLPFLISSAMALTLVVSNSNSAIAVPNEAIPTNAEDQYVYKTLEEAVSDSENEIPQPFGQPFSKSVEYKEKTKVKADTPAIKKVIDEHPDLYSNLYYNPEKGTVVVQITQDSNELKDNIYKKVKNKDKIEFEITKYSKKEIDHAKSRIKEKAPKGSVKALIPDVLNNRLIVVLGENGKKEEVLSKVADPDMLILDEQLSIKPQEKADLTDFGTIIPSGAYITGNYRTIDGELYGTICTSGYYGLTDSGDEVMVTSGHCQPAGSSSAWYQPWNGLTIGNFTFRTTSSLNGTDGASDSGYITLNGHEGRPVVPYNGSLVKITGVYTSDIVGDTVYARGANSGQMSSATIAFTNVDIYWGSQGYGYKENEILTNGFLEPDVIGGDSGAPVLTDYAWDNNRGSYTFDLAGTITGEVTINGNSSIIPNGSYGVYEPLWMSYSDLNLDGILLSQ